MPSHGSLSQRRVQAPITCVRSYTSSVLRTLVARRLEVVSASGERLMLLLDSRHRSRRDVGVIAVPCRANPLPSPVAVSWPEMYANLSNDQRVDANKRYLRTLICTLATRNLLVLTAGGSAKHGEHLILRLGSTASGPYVMALPIPHHNEKVKTNPKKRRWKENSKMQMSTNLKAFKLSLKRARTCLTPRPVAHQLETDLKTLRKPLKQINGLMHIASSPPSEGSRSKSRPNTVHNQYPSTAIPLKTGNGGKASEEMLAASMLLAMQTTSAE